MSVNGPDVSEKHAAWAVHRIATSLFDVILAWGQSDRKAFVQSLASYPKDRLQVCGLSGHLIHPLSFGLWKPALAVLLAAGGPAKWCRVCDILVEQAAWFCDRQLSPGVPCATQALVHRTQQLLTLSVLEGSPDDELEQNVRFLGVLFEANQQSRSLPISDFYNDAGLRPCSVVFVA